MAFNWQFWKKNEQGSDVPAPPETSGKAPEAAGAGFTDAIKKLKGGLPQLLAAARNPAVMKKVRELEARMTADGVDVKDEKKVMAWMEAHKQELMGQQGPKVQTYVHTGPQIGRNDPCHCGSGKKFKKCHGTES